MKGRNNPNSNGGPRNLLIAVAIGLVCLLVVTKLHHDIRSKSEKSFSQLMSAINSGYVKQIEVDGPVAQWRSSDDQMYQTITPSDPQLWEKLQQKGVEINFKDASTKMGMWQIILLIVVFGFGIAIFWYMFRQGRGNSNSGGGTNIFTMGKSRAKMFLPSSIKEKFTSVAGATEAKEELLDVVDFLKNPEKYTRLGAKITRGVL